MSWLDAPPPAAAIGAPRHEADAARYRRALESVRALLGRPAPPDTTRDELLIAVNTIVRNALRS